MAKNSLHRDDPGEPGEAPPVQLHCTLNDDAERQGHRGSINRICWSPDGQMLASGSWDNSVRLWNVNSCKCSHVLTGHRNPVYTVAWSSNERWLASGSVDKSIRLWDFIAGDRSKVLREHGGSVNSLDWAPDGQTLASGSGDRTVRIWHAEADHSLRTLQGHSDTVIAVAWSPDGTRIASGSADMTIRVWDAATGKLQRALLGHDGAILSLCWLNDRTLVSGSFDRTIQVWEVHSGRPAHILEGHTGPVYSVDLAAGGRLLASKADDNTVRLWRCATWEKLWKIEERAVSIGRPGVAFHPKSTSHSALATLGPENRVIRIWDLDLATLLADEAGRRSAHYSNAKVVLVGNTGVGKTGLGLVLRGEKFKATESSHGLDVKLLEKDEVPLDGGRRITRESFLWDLAGQPAFRIVHQLHLSEVAVALVLFDARSETDPFAGVAYWARALDQATSGFPLVKFLIASRTDRGGPPVSQDRIDAYLRKFGFAAYIDSSAKRRKGVVAMKQAIRRAIAWDKLPRVSTTALFMGIRKFLIDEQKNASSVVTTVEDLFDRLRMLREHADITRDVFETCLGRLESAGLIRRLSFNDHVLLQPQKLDDYCGWLLLAAQDQPDGLGYIEEEFAKQGKFPMDPDRRLREKFQEEQIILLAAVQELVVRKIAYLAGTGRGTMLVFPSELKTDLPAYPGNYLLEVVFYFEGPVSAIYAILAVTLIHSKEYEKHELYRYAALYRKQGSEGVVLGFAVEFPDTTDDSKGKLTVFFGANTPRDDRDVFLGTLSQLLAELALVGSVHRERIYYCRKCPVPRLIPPEFVRARRASGMTDVICPVCESRYPIDDPAEPSAAEDDRVRAIADRAEEGKDRQARQTTFREREQAGEFDVLLFYIRNDQAAVQELAGKIYDQKILYRMNQKTLPGGIPQAEFMKEKLNEDLVLVVCIGPQGLGSKQEAENYDSLRNYIEECGRAGRRVRIVPVLLPGAQSQPLPLLLGGLEVVDFQNGLDNDIEFRKLIRAIVDTTPQF